MRPYSGSGKLLMRCLIRYSAWSRCFWSSASSLSFASSRDWSTFCAYTQITFDFLEPVWRRAKTIVFARKKETTPRYVLDLVFCVVTLSKESGELFAPWQRVGLKNLLRLHANQTEPLYFPGSFKNARTYDMRRTCLTKTPCFESETLNI